MKAYIHTNPVYADQQVSEKEIYLDFTQWEDLWNYLLFDRKFKKTYKNKSSYQSRFRVLCRYLNGSPFNRTNFNIVISKLEAQNFSNAYLNKFVSFGKIIDKYYGTNHVLDYTYFAKEEKKMFETLTPEEIVKLAEVKLDYVRGFIEINKRDKALIYLIATTGCRLGEALSLTWNDLYGDPKAVLFRETKNGRNRLVPISDEVYSLLISQPHWNKEYVFGTMFSGRVDHSAFGVILKKRAEKAGIKKLVFPHLFRHSFITEMIKAGVSVIHIARIVGHSDVSTTNLYAQLVIDDLAEVIHYHPLLRSGISFEKLTKKMKLILNQSADKDKYATYIHESPTEFTITIKKI